MPEETGGVPSMNCSNVGNNARGAPPTTPTRKPNNTSSSRKTYPLLSCCCPCLTGGHHEHRDEPLRVFRLRGDPGLQVAMELRER